MLIATCSSFATVVTFSLHHGVTFSARNNRIFKSIVQEKSFYGSAFWMAVAGILMQFCSLSMVSADIFLRFIKMHASLRWFIYVRLVLSHFIFNKFLMKLLFDDNSNYTSIAYIACFRRPKVSDKRMRLRLSNLNYAYIFVHCVFMKYTVSHNDVPPE